MRFFLFICLFCSCLTSTVSAKVLLIENVEIWNELIEISVANKISEECKTIKARKIKGLFALLEIKTEAAQLGYNDVEINDFINNEENREKLANETDIYLVDNGVDLNDNHTFCIFGEHEINKESTIGSLLRIE